MENSTNLAYSKAIACYRSGECIKQVSRRARRPEIRRTAKKNRMRSTRSVKTKVTSPLVTRKGGKKKKRKKKFRAGQIKSYIYGIEARQGGCEPAALSK